MKVGGRIPWNVTAIFETFKIFYLMGRRSMKDVLGNHLKDRLFHLVLWLSITLSLRKDLSRLHQFGPEVLQVYSSVMSCMREESGEQTLKNWSRWTRLHSTPEGSMQKER